MLSTLYMRTINVGLESIGLTSFFSLPWILKFFWAPLVDRFGTKRVWLLMMQGVLVVLFVAIGVGTSINGGISVVAALFLGAAFFAATHDVAIDGFYMAALDTKDQATFIGFRVTAYRIAMMTGTGIIATIGTKWGWMQGFAAAGGLLLLVWVYHVVFLPKTEIKTHALRSAFVPLARLSFITGAVALSGGIVLLYRLVNSPWYGGVRAAVPLLKGMSFAGWISMLLLGALVAVGVLHKKIAELLSNNPDSFYSKAFVSFMDRRGIGSILAFVILLRTGEFLLTKMTSSFMVDLGIKVHYGWLQAGVGLPASIAGAMLGGYFISRFGLKQMLFPFLLLQNGSNIIYMILAFALKHFVASNTGNTTPDPIGAINLIAVAVVQGFDQLSGGLGTAVLMTFLMKLCKGTYKAAHYAIGSGLMSISGLFTGVASGFIAAKLGYGWFFGVSFLLSVPGMVLAFPALRAVGDEEQ